MANGNIVYGMDLVGRAQHASVAGLLISYFSVPQKHGDTVTYAKNGAEATVEITKAGAFKIALKAADRKALDDIVNGLRSIGLSTESDKPRIVSVKPSEVPAANKA